MKIHRMKENEDIYSLSREYEIAPSILMDNNGIYGVKRPPMDVEMLIATPTRTYNVRRGDTLYAIAKRFGVNEEYLKQINPSLNGRCNLYPSQILAIKYQDRMFGTCASVGYLYQGYRLDKLIRTMPYLSYVTVCAARLVGEKIDMLFQDNKIVELVKKEKKRALLRIYAPNISNRDIGKNEFIKSAIFIAGAHGYDGITLSEPNLKGKCHEEYNEFIMNFTSKCGECGLTLFTEADLCKEHSYCKFSNHAILTYDKLHLKEIPTFLEGEYSKMQTFADNFDSIRAFIELPSFVFDGEKYIPEEDVARKIIKGRLNVEHDDEGKIMRCTSQNESYITASLENIKAKLEAVSELGFMGVWFDIMRIDIRELFLLSQMFAIANLPKTESKLRCDGTKSDG